MNQSEPSRSRRLRRNAVKALIAAAVLAAVTWGAFHFRLLGANVHANWSYDYTPEPPCSTNRAVNCIDHFEVLDITSQKFTSIATAANPSPASGKVDNISVTFKYGPPFGERTLSVVAVGRDRLGNRVTSNPYAATGAASIRPKANVTTILR